jgi:hypothetical protein
MTLQKIKRDAEEYSVTTSRRP